MNNQIYVKNDFFIETENREKYIEKMRFCIISCYKSQISKNNLMLFTLDNNQFE